MISEIKKKFANHKAGFTILETLVAIGVFVMGIMGPLNLGIYAMRTASVAKNYTIAFYLADEGLEWFRWRRDSNTFSSDPWLRYLNQCQGANGCYIDTTNNTVGACGATCPVLRQESSTRRYGYTGGWTATMFSRRVSYVDLSAYEVRVTSTVTWQEKFGPKSITLEEYFYDWK
jgi:Tfp pilus assembly protein PilV